MTLTQTLAPPGATTVPPCGDAAQDPDAGTTGDSLPTRSSTRRVCGADRIVQRLAASARRGCRDGRRSVSGYIPAAERGLHCGPAWRRSAANDVPGMAAALALFLHRLGEPPKPLRHGMPPGASARCVAKGLIVEAINGAVSAKLAWHEGLPSVLSIMTLLMLFCDLVAASSAGRQAPGAAGGRVRRRLQPAHGLTARRT